MLQYIYCYHHPLRIEKRTLRFSETKQFAQDSFSVVALGFEPRLSETNVWHLITKPCNLPLEIDLEINMGEESIQMEETVFQRYNDIFRLARFFVSRVRTGQVEGNRIALLEEGRKDMLIALTRALNLWHWDHGMKAKLDAERTQAQVQVVKTEIWAPGRVLSRSLGNLT